MVFHLHTDRIISLRRKIHNKKYFYSLFFKILSNSIGICIIKIDIEYYFSVEL